MIYHVSQANALGQILEWLGCTRCYLPMRSALGVEGAKKLRNARGEYLKLLSTTLDPLDRCPKDLKDRESRGQVWDGSQG